jgi:cytochrome P450
MQGDIISYGNTIWHEHGDYLCDRLLYKECLFLFHPDALEYVLQKQNTHYSKDVFMFQPMKVLLGEGLTTSEGELWLKQRRLLQPFFSRARVNSFVPIMVETVSQFLDGMQSRQGNIVEMQQEMDQLALMISVRTLFQNTNLDPIAFIRDLKGIGPDITSYIRLPFPPIVIPTPRNRRLKHKIDLLDSHIERVIQGRRENPVSGETDTLQTLIEHNDPQQVRDELMTLIIAGYQTTSLSLSLSFTWSLLAQYPTAAQKLRHEVDAVLGDHTLTEEDLPRFEYARAVFMETLRLYPASFELIRQATQDDIIAGHEVKAGTVICMAPYFTHRHPSFWTDPEHFDPERFLPGGTKPHHRYAYLPFGGGPHICMGNQFALVEALVILVMLSRRYNIRFANDSFRPEVQAMAVMKMKELPMVFKAR